MSDPLLPTKVPFSVRRATTDDVASVVNMRIELTGKAGDAFRGDHTDWSSVPLTTWVDMVRRDPYYVAEHHGDVIGCVNGGAYNLRFTPTAGLYSLYVRAGHRHLGVGTALVEVLCAQARSDGYHGVCLDVLSTNVNAVSFYEKRAFRTLGYRNRRVDGSTLTLLRMHRTLGNNDAGNSTHRA